MSLTAKKVYAILNGKIVKINGAIETIKHPVIYQGSVKNESELPQKPENGWMYNIQEKSSYGEAGMNVVFTKDGWDAMGAMIDTSLFLKKEDLGTIISPNLFNPIEVKENTAINQNDGTEMSFDHWIATGYIPVSKNDVLYFSANNEPTHYSTGAFYDIQKKFISGFGNPNGNDTITVTSDGYARFSFGSKKEKLQIEKGSRTTYVPYGELKIKAEVDNVKKDIDNIKKKKNVVIYVGSSELSAEQKLSCDYVCDGVDDQIEINQAIDSLPDSGGEIHLSRGIFNITNAICIRKRIKIVGEGKGITLDRNNVNNGGTTLLSESTNWAIIVIEKSNTLSDIKGITLSDFQIVGAGINVENNFCNGINVNTYADCVTLERLAICHCFYGLFVDQSATVDDISITNCDFQRDTCGIFIYGKGWQTRIENNIFWDMSGRQSTSGIVLSAGKNIVNGNYFGVSSLVSQERTSAWISAKNAVSLLCNGNSFSRCTSSPIRFEAGGQFASISGNSFSEIGKAQFQSNERAVLYVDGAGTGGGRIAFTNNTVFWANGDDWKTSYLAYLTNQAAQVNISNNTVIDGIGKITEDELVYKSEDSAYAITIGNNALC